MTCADPPLMTTTDAVTGHVEETQGRRGTKLYLSLWMLSLPSLGVMMLRLLKLSSDSSSAQSTNAHERTNEKVEFCLQNAAI